MARRGWKFPAPEPTTPRDESHPEFSRWERKSSEETRWDAGYTRESIVPDRGLLDRKACIAGKTVPEYWGMGRRGDNRNAEGFW